jgi:hypothetical protein
MIFLGLENNMNFLEVVINLFLLIDTFNFYIETLW